MSESQEDRGQIIKGISLAFRNLSLDMFSESGEDSGEAELWGTEVGVCNLSVWTPPPPQSLLGGEGCSWV